MTNELYSLNVYLNEISNYKNIPNEKIIDLFKKIQEGDMDAKQEIINSQLKLVVFIAKKYAKNNDELMDLIQEGNMGLLNAINHYDYKIGSSFSTFAFYSIKKCIIKYKRNMRHIVALPENKKAIISHLLIVKETFYKLNGRFPNIKEYVKENNKLYPKDTINITTFLNIQPYLLSTISINQPLKNNEKVEISDTIVDEYELDVIDKMLEINSYDYIWKILNNEIPSILSKNEIEVLNSIYKDELDISEIVKKMQLKRKDILELHKSGLVKLRKIIQIVESKFNNNNKRIKLG